MVHLRLKAAVQPVLLSPAPAKFQSNIHLFHLSTFDFNVIFYRWTFMVVILCLFLFTVVLHRITSDPAPLQVDIQKPPVSLRGGGVTQRTVAPKTIPSDYTTNKLVPAQDIRSKMLSAQKTVTDSPEISTSGSLKDITNRIEKATDVKTPHVVTVAATTPPVTTEATTAPPVITEAATAPIATEAAEIVKQVVSEAVTTPPEPEILEEPESALEEKENGVSRGEELAAILAQQKAKTATAEEGDTVPSKEREGGGASSRGEEFAAILALREKEEKEKEGVGEKRPEVQAVQISHPVPDELSEGE
jgi:hypothetical protein